MRIINTYSHLNGEEYLMVRNPKLLDEVRNVIAEVDAHSCKTKVSRERTMEGRTTFSLGYMNKAFNQGFGKLGWKEQRNSFCVATDEKLLRTIHSDAPNEQNIAIEDAGHEPIASYHQTDFVKERVAVEVQFGQYSFDAHDLFSKHLSFYVSDIIDVGIEILPMKELEWEMSSDVPYFERSLLNVIRQGRGVPPVPLVLIGVAP